MARSYFSRLVRGGESALLAPQRPTSNLWKTAQMDAAVSVPDAAPAPTSHRNPMQRSRAAEPVPPPMPAALQSRPAPPLAPAEPVGSGPRTRASQAVVPVEASRNPPEVAASGRVEAAQHDAAGRAERGRAGQRQAVPALQAPERAALAVASPSSAPAFSARREPSRQPAVPATAARPAEAKSFPAEARLPHALEPIPPVARLATERQPAPVSVSASHGHAADAAHAAPAFLPAPAPIAEPASGITPPQARLQPIEWATPTRSRELSRAARQSPTPQEPRANGNTVQIGKIEVQVVPPVASSYRPAQPAPTKVRLARGYALWPGW